MKKYGSFSGTVTMIQDYLVGSDEELKGCFKFMIKIVCEMKIKEEKYMDSKRVWSKDKSIFQFRIARPTDKINELIQFYEEGLELQRVGYFHHDGYEGVMFGLPGRDYHLEFTQHEDGSPGPAPTKENVLVFYYVDIDEKERRIKKLNSMGYKTVPSENPY